MFHYYLLPEVLLSPVGTRNYNEIFTNAYAVNTGKCHASRKKIRKKKCNNNTSFIAVPRNIISRHTSPPYRKLFKTDIFRKKKY